MACPFGKTADGYETQFGTNHLGHFLLTVSLLPKLLESKGRVVNVASTGHHFVSAGLNSDVLNGLNSKEGYNEWIAYGTSKLGNILFARELHTRFHDQGLIAVSLHPGGIMTELARHQPAAARAAMKVASVFLKSIPAGADTQMRCCLDPQISAGEYYTDCHTFPTSKWGSDAKQSAWLWDYSMKQVRNFVDPSVVSLLEKKSGSSEPSSDSGDDKSRRRKK